MSITIAEIKQLLQESQAATLEDLKQYIDARLDAQSAEFDRAMGALRTDMQDGFMGVAESFDIIGADVDKTFHNHERRITRLEKTSGLISMLARLEIAFV